MNGSKGARVPWRAWRSTALAALRDLDGHHVGAVGVFVELQDDLNLRWHAGSPPRGGRIGVRRGRLARHRAASPRAWGRRYGACPSLDMIVEDPALVRAFLVGPKRPDSPDPEQPPRPKPHPPELPRRPEEEPPERPFEGPPLPPGEPGVPEIGDPPQDDPQLS